MMMAGGDRWSNLAAILADLRARGVEFRLSSAGPMQYRDRAGVLTEDEHMGLGMCRQSLTMQLRREASLCIKCGVNRPYKDTDRCLYCVPADPGPTN